MTEPHQPDHVTHACPKCGEPITGTTAVDFEIIWENHKAAHKAEEERENLQDPEAHEGLLVPTDTQLNEATAKAQKDSALMERLFQNEQDALTDLEKHFDGVSRIEHKLPQFIDFAFKMANQVGQWAKEKDFRTKAIKLGMIYWTPAGDIAAEFLYDKYDLSAPDEVPYLKRGYARLPQLNSQYPAVFELVITLGEHLTNLCVNRKVQPRDISFTGLHVFQNPNTREYMWSFKILNRRHILKAAKVGF